jgi:hypothetical protein
MNFDGNFRKFERGLNTYNYFKIEHEILLSMLPKNIADWKYFGEADEDYSGLIGYFQTEEEVNRFSSWLNTLKENRT